MMASALLLIGLWELSGLKRLGITAVGEKLKLTRATIGLIVEGPWLVVCGPHFGKPLLHISSGPGAALSSSLNAHPPFPTAAPPGSF